MDKGLLEKGGSLGRGRIRRVDVTDKGRALLQADPLNVLVEALASLEGPQKRSLAEALERMLSRLQAQKRPQDGGDSEDGTGGLASGSESP